MDTNTDWAKQKEQEKNKRYSSHLGFINHLINREKSGWKASLTNFTTGVRDSLYTNQFLTRLESLGVKNKNTREAVRNRTFQKTLSMSDMILMFFFIALNSKTEQSGHSKNYPQKSSTRTWKDLIYTSNHQRRDQITQFSQKKKVQPTYHNLPHTSARFQDEGATHTYSKYRILTLVLTNDN